MPHTTTGKQRNLHPHQLPSFDIDQYSRRTNQIPNLNNEEINELSNLNRNTVAEGSNQNSKDKIIKFRERKFYLAKTKKIAGRAMRGIYAKNALENFLQEDYTGLAINLGLIPGSIASTQIAGASYQMGTALIVDGNLIQGRYLQLASPFLGRATSGFVIYDFVKQIKDLQAGNKDALANVIGDGASLAFSSTGIGVEIVEVFGFLEGVSAITSPIGAVGGLIALFGADIYQLAENVIKIKQQFHLDPMQTFTSGLRMFIGMNPSAELLKEKMDNCLSYEAAELLKLPYIQSYIFPTCEISGITCKSKLNKKIILSKFAEKETIASYSKAIIANPSGVKILCSPVKEVVQPKGCPRDLLLFFGRQVCKSGSSPPSIFIPNGFQRMDETSYFCENAIGFSSTVIKSKNYTLIDLGNGATEVEGFLNSVNIMLLGNGDKKVNGGNEDDTFIVRGNTTSGVINGGKGTNTLDLSDFALDQSLIIVNLPAGYINDFSFLINSVNRILTRKEKQDAIFCACDTNYVDGGGGGEEGNSKDTITVDEYDCFYEMRLIARANTSVYNNALKGSFDYVLTLEKGNVDIVLSSDSRAEHRLIFNCTLFDLDQIILSGNRTVTITTRLLILPHHYSNVTVSYHSQNKVSYFLNDYTEIKVDIAGKNNLYMLQKSEKTSQEIIDFYPTKANQLKTSMFIHLLPNNETVAIGHGRQEILSNNPYYKSHLVGNGGENVFMIISGYKTLEASKLPIPEVVLYDVDSENLIDTLDLREIIQQLKKDLSLDIKIKTSVACNDVLIKIFSTNDILSVATIRLKDALPANWHKRLHIFLNSAPLTFDEINLKPVPLVFPQEYNWIVIQSEDIEENTQVVIPKKSGDFRFIRLENSLLISNAFGCNPTSPDCYSILCPDFYKKVESKILPNKFETLSIKFTDSEIVLKNKTNGIHAALTFDEQTAAHQHKTITTQKRLFNRTNIEQSSRKRRAVVGTRNVNSGLLLKNTARKSATRTKSWRNQLSFWSENIPVSSRATSISTASTGFNHESTAPRTELLQLGQVRFNSHQKLLKFGTEKARTVTHKTTPPTNIDVNTWVVFLAWLFRLKLAPAPREEIEIIAKPCFECYRLVSQALKMEFSKPGR